MNIKTKRERKKEEYVKDYLESIIEYRDAMDKLRFDNSIAKRLYEDYDSQVQVLKQILKAFEEIDKNRP